MRPKGTIIVSLLVIAGMILGGHALFAGSVTGKITYDDRLPNLRAIDMNADPKCAAKHSAPVKPETLVVGSGNGLANVMVYIKNAPAGGSAPSQPVVVDQKGCVYKPHVVGVMLGQSLQFKNSDGLLHNVHGLPKVNRQFNRAQPGTSPPFEVTFTKAEELFRVKCDVHPWMETYVAVMTHPYFAVTGPDGSFKIDLPDGQYTLAAKHHFAKFPELTAEITVSGGAVSHDFSFTR